MISLGNQNQFPSSFAPLGDLLKALMFLPRCGMKKTSSDLVTFFSLFPFLFLCLHYLCFLLYYFELVWFLCYALVNMFLFVYF